ncbi:MAG: chorismate mutase, partial [Cyanobium sp.]
MLNGDGIALLDCQQMAVRGDLPRCIRLLAHAWLEVDREPSHPYLREASRLRPDRAS